MIGIEVVGFEDSWLIKYWKKKPDDSPELAMLKKPAAPCLALKFSSGKESPNLLIEPKPFPEITSPPTGKNIKQAEVSQKRNHIKH